MTSTTPSTIDLEDAQQVAEQAVLIAARQMVAIWQSGRDFNLEAERAETLIECVTLSDRLRDPGAPLGPLDVTDYRNQLVVAACEVIENTEDRIGGTAPGEDAYVAFLTDSASAARRVYEALGVEG